MNFPHETREHLLHNRYMVLEVVRRYRVRLPRKLLGFYSDKTEIGVLTLIGETGVQ
jgi:hypothetical protein